MWSAAESGYGDFRDRLEAFEDFLEERHFEGEDNEKVYDPDKARGTLQKLWFERRQLHWEGLHNLIDDARVAKKYNTDKTSK